MKSTEQDDFLQFMHLFFLFVLSFFLPIVESYISRQNHVFNRLNKKMNEIDGDKFEPSHEDLVYYYTEKMQYSRIKDPLFGFSHPCVKLERNVQYCQWVEIPYPERIVDSKTNISKTIYHYKYYKKWLHTPMSSFLFHNQIYNNPRVNEIPEISFRSKHARAGAYKIGFDIEYNGKSHHFTPSSSQIQNFEENKKVDFEYAGRGIFYSSYKAGFLDQLLRTAQFFDLKSEIISWCNPGDRRVWYETWDNENATIIGFRDNDTIYSFDYKGNKIGSINPGKVSLDFLIKLNSSTFISQLCLSLRISVFFYLLISDASFGVCDFLGAFCLIMYAVIAHSYAFKTFGSLVFAICCVLVSYVVFNVEDSLVKKYGIKKIVERKIDAFEKAKSNVPKTVNKSDFSFGDFMNNVALPDLRLYLASSARRPMMTQYNDDINGGIDNFVENDADRNENQNMRPCRNRKIIIYDDDNDNSDAFENSRINNSSERQNIIVDDDNDDNKFANKDRFNNDFHDEL